MSKIFISYRRNDTNDISGRIYDRIRLRYGKSRVFKDVFNIAPGEASEERIHAELELSRDHRELRMGISYTPVEGCPCCSMPMLLDECGSLFAIHVPAVSAESDLRSEAIDGIQSATPRSGS